MNSDLIPERTDYGERSLDVEHLKDDPMLLFQEWMAEAVSEGVPEANAMCLSTIDGEGFPDSRIVLLKGVEEAALHFYTNYQSRKGLQLGANGKAAVVFWWEPLKRQVRFSGQVERLSREASDSYFATRPRESQLGAWASLQSQVVEDRQVLIDRLQEASEQFPQDVPRPPHWGGFRLSPKRVEFWQGRTSRLHDRFQYVSAGSGWSVCRLMP